MFHSKINTAANSISKSLLLITLFCSCLISCSTKNTQIRKDTTIVNIKFVKGKPLPPKEWHVYKINTNEEWIFIPESWHLINEDRFLLTARLNVPDSESHFLVLKLDQKEVKLNAVGYMRESYKEFIDGSLQKLTGYKTTKLVYNDKVVFSSEFNTLMDNKSYVTYSTVFEKDNYIFDIVLKVGASDNAQDYQEKYRDILFNFYYKTKQIFSITDTVKDIKFIDLAKL